MKDDAEGRFADPRFIACLRESAKHKELVAEYDRLFGSNLSRRGTGLQRAIDDATGRTEAELRAFADFVYDHIYSRLPPEENEGDSQ